MFLYHGSNTKVNNPKILPNLRALDFGAGFYLTSSKEQAKKWAITVTKRRNQGTPIINIYEFNENVFKNLKVLKFESANGDWLDFVISNRKNIANNSYDIVIGPVANDSTLPVIDNYISNVYTKEEAVKRLLPQNLTDQFAFLTAKALTYLKFLKEELLWKKFLWRLIVIFQISL